MPGGNGFRFDDDQDIAPCRPKTAEQNPEYSVFRSQPRARMFSLEYAQLLPEGKDLQAEAVTGTEEGIEEGSRSPKLTCGGDPRFFPGLGFSLRASVVTSCYHGLPRQL
jgi:hypothetical protein